MKARLAVAMCLPAIPAPAVAGIEGFGWLSGLVGSCRAGELSGKAGSAR